MLFWRGNTQNPDTTQPRNLVGLGWQTDDREAEGQTTLGNLLEGQIGDLDTGKAREVENATVALLPDVPLDVNEVTAHPPPSGLVIAGEGGIPPLIN